MAKIVGHARLVIAGAIILGLIMASGLTMLLMARDSSLKDCIITEMKRETPGIMADVLRLCAERRGDPQPERRRLR
jgi:hypothetical protein